ncbi:uracil-DNA glycosylase-like protein, partial [Cladochytrium replicatum]
LPDILRVDLDILFIGINPGIVSSQKGHHYAGHNNHFWGCLFESGLVKEKLTYADDSLCPDRYNFGFTNIVSRCTRSCDELTRTELVAGGRELLSKIKRATPRIVAFVGVEVYDSFLEAYSEAASNPAEARAKFKRTSLGSQKWRIQVKKQNSSEIKVIRLFVMPSTSGRVVQYQKEDKLEFFKDLKALLDELKAS